MAITCPHIIYFLKAALLIVPLRLLKQFILVTFFFIYLFIYFLRI